MTVSKKQQASVTKYVKAHYYRPAVTIPKAKEAAIKAHAENRGETVNQFINRAITETMEREAADTDDDAFCNALCDQYERDPDKGNPVSLEEAARFWGCLCE